MSEVEDAACRQLKRHRVDIGLPRGALLTKVNSFANSNGVFQENVESNTEVLRKLLKLNHSQQTIQTAEPKEKLNSSGNESEEDLDQCSDSELQEDLDAERVDIPVDRRPSPAMPTAQMAQWEECNGSTSPMQETITDSLKAKRARVENIITSMRHSPPTVSAQDPSGMEDSLRKPKRKQYQPQPQRWDSGDEEYAVNHSRKQEKTKLKGILTHLQKQLNTLQEKYLNAYDEEDGNLSDNSDDMDDLNEPIDTSSAFQKYEMNGVEGSPPKGSNERKRRADGSCILDHSTSLIVRQTLKEELPPLLLNAVDSVMSKITKSASKHASKHPSNTSVSTTQAKSEVVSNQSRNSVLTHHSSPPAPAQESKPTPPPPALFHPSFLMRPFPNFEQQTEAMSLVTSARKRVRNSERSLPSGFHPGDMPMKPEPLIPVSLPTSVAIPNPSLHPTLGAPFMTPPMLDPRDHFESLRHMYAGSPMVPSHLSPLHYVNDHRSSPGDLSHLPESPYSGMKVEGHDTSPLHSHDRPSSADLSDYSPLNGTSITCTLTPTHLRKAKLMFFFVRYPSSALLRQHFPDVKFNRHNTSQIIKWFSNFREFYYIQMEKFSRQAVSDNVESADDLKVTRDSELYRSLNLHYNKSNEFTVPEGFLHVATTTLREFFTAVKNTKDQEPSWKKTIYKVISKLDEPLPPFFKNPNCLDLLPL